VQGTGVSCLYCAAPWHDNDLYNVHELVHLHDHKFNLYFSVVWVYYAAPQFDIVCTSLMELYAGRESVHLHDHEYNFTKVANVTKFVSCDAMQSVVYLHDHELKM